MAALCLCHPHEKGSAHLDFGFFPNHNHTATLLVMGTFAGLGCFAQAIRQRDPWKAGMSGAASCLFLGVLLWVSESRAGIVLVAAGLVGWVGLTGLRHLRGHAGKAIILLVIALGGMFLIMDSKVKTRLNATVIQENTPVHTGVNALIQFHESADHPSMGMDGRVAIYHDTWSMIRHESWPGVGPGQFARVFPQYRQVTNAPNGQACLHPESDWLWMLAETGWPATLCLLAGAVAIWRVVWKQVRTGRTRFLRAGSLVAAMVLCLHGVFDVPGHRVGLMWAGVLLAAMCLRMPAAEDGGVVGRSSRGTQVIWRCVGGVLVAAGGFLLLAQLVGWPVLPSARVFGRMEEAKELYDADQAAYDRAVAEGRDYQPPADQDPLESAMKCVADALRITPLDPHPHYVMGALAAHYDDKQETVNREFAIQRRLDPTRINSVLMQARAWMAQAPQQTVTLWAEALRRASAEEARLPKAADNIAATFHQMVIDAVACGNEELELKALEIAEGKPKLLAEWAGSVPPALLDRELPRLLAATENSGDRKALHQIWKKRGTKGTAAEFAASHPELDLNPPP